MPISYAPLAATLDREANWFTRVLEERMRRMGEGAAAGPVVSLPPPAFRDPCAYGAVVNAHQLGWRERLSLILALLPWVRPEALDPLLLSNQAIGRPFTEFGGGFVPGRGFAPTRQTALFLFAGDNPVRRARSMAMFAVDGRLVVARLIAPQPDDYAPWMPLEPHPQLIERLFRAPE
jgi:hypothetical protein